MKPLYLAPALVAGMLLLGNHAGAGDKGTVVTLGALKSTAPANWKSQAPANKFRAYQFTLGDAELVIFDFGEGGGGNLADNIARWKSQFLPPEGKTIEEASKLDKFKVGPAEVTYLDIQGTFLSKNPPFDPNAKTERKAKYRRFGIYFAAAGGPYFITLTGPAGTLEQNKKAFDEWLKNFNDHPAAQAMTGFLFDFEVPPRLIAQQPIEPRDQARLLAVSRIGPALVHRHFFDLPELLHPGDLLVLNDTRVLHARLIGRRAATGGKWEGLFLRAWPDGTWEILSQTGGQPKPGEIIAVDPAPLELKLIGKLTGGRWQVEPNLPGSATVILQQAGRIPLPPYIRKGKAQPEDGSRYQTVFAPQDGAVAAPTAGLHFTPAVFERLAKRGVSWTFVTLHVGLGTFQPMQTEDPALHVMHREWGELTKEAARAISERQAAGGRIVAVGTTSVRVLETVAHTGPMREWSGETDLFVYPPFDFRAVDALITNFHFPKTTLLLLVGAFAGVPLLEQAYRMAIKENYRFFSYGDAMLIE